MVTLDSKSMRSHHSRETGRPAERGDLPVYLDCTSHNVCPCRRAPTTERRWSDRVQPADVGASQSSPNSTRIPDRAPSQKKNLSRFASSIFVCFSSSNACEFDFSFKCRMMIMILSCVRHCRFVQRLKGATAAGTNTGNPGPRGPIRQRCLCFVFVFFLDACCVSCSSSSRRASAARSGRRLPRPAPQSWKLQLRQQPQ